MAKQGHKMVNSRFYSKYIKMPTFWGQSKVIRSEYHIDDTIGHAQTTIKHLALLLEDCIMGTTYTLYNDT